MSKKDTVSKEFFRIPERFADTYNGILFGGNEVIKPSELSEIDAEYAYVNRKDNKTIVDIARKWEKQGVILALLVQENQTNIDYAMVTRNMLSESLIYNQQVSDIEKKHREKKDLKSGSEYISGITRGDKLTPVVMIVIYLGKERWDGATTLHEMLMIDDKLKSYVSNHKINLYDYHEYEQFDNFNTDVSLAFEALSAHSDKNKLRNMFKGQRKIIASDTMRFIATMLDIKNIDRYITVDENGEEMGDMCKAVEDLREEGKMETLIDLVKKGLLEIKVAAEQAGMSVSEFEVILNM